MSNTQDVQAIDQLKVDFERLKQELSKVIVGQEEVINGLLLAIFSNGHCLLEGVPGLAKTLLVNTLSKTLGLDFKRIQFTPDLMPSDITGSEILNDQRQFEFVKGPLFTQLLLADEINRTPPKTQAALLEAMQERVVTTGGKTLPLDKPFFVLATQNPIEQEGTYSLPEAQLDRFMFHIAVGYPSLEEEMAIVKNTTGHQEAKVNQVMSGEQILAIQSLLKRIPVTDNVYDYAVRLVAKTRPNTSHSDELTNKYLAWGAGPRASQYLIVGAKAHAAVRGKYAPDIEDVQAVAPMVLRHRIVRNYKAEAEGFSNEAIIAKLF